MMGRLAWSSTSWVISHSSMLVIVMLHNGRCELSSSVCPAHGCPGCHLLLPPVQDLTLSIGPSMEGTCLQLLPSSVTSLVLDDTERGDPAAIQAAALPSQLDRLTALVHLELTECSLHPKVLASFTQLTHLELHHCKALPVDPDGGPHVAGTTALLAALAKLIVLQDLQLDCLDFDIEFVSKEACAGLTASTKLTNLYICPKVVQPVPSGVVGPYMSPAGRSMPGLQNLNTLLHLR